MSKLNLSNILNEIKVNKPTEIFTFKDDPTYGIIAGRYIVVGEDEDDYKLQNLKTKGFEYVSKHYAKNNRIEQSTNEIKVNPPVNKRKAFEDMLNFDENMLSSLIPYDTLDELIGEHGYDSLEELLTDNYGITDPQPYIPLITNFYRAIKPEDITYVREGATIKPVAGYKNAIVIEQDIGERNPIYNFLLLKF